MSENRLELISQSAKRKTTSIFWDMNEIFIMSWLSLERTEYDEQACSC